MIVRGDVPTLPSYPRERAPIARVEQRPRVPKIDGAEEALTDLVHQHPNALKELSTVTRRRLLRYLKVSTAPHTGAQLAIRSRLQRQQPRTTLHDDWPYREGAEPPAIKAPSGGEDMPDEEIAFWLESNADLMSRVRQRFIEL